MLQRSNNSEKERIWRAALQSSSIEDTEWRQALNVNLLSAVRLDSALLPSMLERGSGVIIHISSGTARLPMPAMLHYAASKAALTTYSKGLALEVAPRGVRVNIATLGMIETPLQTSIT